ncbi:MAG TPA: ATP-binding protein [Anaeromyxobacter sp.]
MTLQRKLALFLVAASVAPLVGVAFAVLRGSQDELARRAAAEHAARARAGAVALAAELAEVDGALAALSETWRPDRLEEPELRGMLVVLSRQVPAADASAVVDAAGSARAALAGDAHESTERFVEAVRTSSGLPEGRLVLRAYDDDGGWRLAAVRAVPARSGPPWHVAVRLAADHARRRLDAAVPDGGGAWLLDGARVLAASTGAGGIPPDQRAELAGRLDPARPSVVQGRHVLAAWSPLEDGTGLGVLVAVPAETAYAPIAAMRRGVLLASLAVLAAVLAASFLLARTTGAGLARIESAARALGGGELSVRLPVRGADEIAQVSRTFNGMAEELQRTREKLERWNEELRREVEARTAELRAAQAQLVESQKLAAIGQLGAGVAHEINNPLTSILGFAQLLAESAPEGSPDREVLESIEAQARRCRDITWNLLRFSEQGAEPDFAALDASQVARDALALARTQIETAGIGLDADLPEPGPRVRGDAGHLASVVLHLLANARTACVGRTGARIRVSVGRDGEEVRIAVRDGGKGIAPEHLPRVFEPFFTTKDLWSNVGLGLSVSYRIVSEHGGRIRAESTPGEGSTFTVSLPTLPPEPGSK